MKLTPHEGYAYASEVDKIFAKVLQKYDVERAENYHGYLSLIRTIESTLTIMKSENEKHAPMFPE